MPTLKNNQGYSAVPILAVLALVLTGTYFGYSYYNSNSQVSIVPVNFENLSAVNTAENPLLSEGDVLQANTGNFNPGNQPFYWSYVDDKRPGIWNITYYFTGKDVKTLERAMDKIKSTGFISYRDSKKPCYSGATRLGIWDTYPVEIKKLSDEFYLMTIRDIKTYYNSPEDKLCGVARTSVSFYYGLKSNEYLASPKNSFPVPASIFFSTSTKTRSAVNTPTADANAPKIDVSGLRRLE